MSKYSLAGGVATYKWLLFGGGLRGLFLLHSLDNFTDVVVWYFVVGDVLLLQVVLRHDFVDLGHSFGGEFVGAHIDWGDVLVAFEGVFQRRGIRLLDHIAGHVHGLDWLVHLQELSKGFAEHVAELVRGEAEEFETWIVVQQVNAKFGAGLVVKSVQTQVERDQWFVDLECLSEETGAIIRNAVIAEVQVSKNLSLENKFSNFSSTWVSNFVVGQVKLGNSLVEHQVLHKNLS